MPIKINGSNTWKKYWVSLSIFIVISSQELRLSGSKLVLTGAYSGYS